MSPTTLVDRARIVGALAEQFAALDTLLSSLAEEDWRRPTPCPGWDVQAQVAHMIGTESMLAGLDAPPTLDGDPPAHVHNDIGALNERWIASLAGESPAALLDRFRTLTAARLETLRALDQEAWDNVGFTPAGTDTYGRFMRIRVYDTWLHEQDIRDAVGRPGHESGGAVDVALDEISGALGYVVGKKAGTPPGSSVTLELTGPTSRAFHVAVAPPDEGGRAALLDSLPGPATATIRFPLGVFVRLAGGRVDPATVVDQLELSGDRALAQSVIGQLNFTI